MPGLVICTPGCLARFVTAGARDFKARLGQRSRAYLAKGGQMADDAMALAPGFDDPACFMRVCQWRWLEGG